MLCRVAFCAKFGAKIGLKFKHNLAFGTQKKIQQQKIDTLESFESSDSFLARLVAFEFGARILIK